MNRRGDIDAPPGGASDMGLRLYASLISTGFSGRTIFATLVCQAACAAHDSGAPEAFLDAFMAAARASVPLVPGMRQEQAVEWAAQQRGKGSTTP